MKILSNFFDPRFVLDEPIDYHFNLHHLGFFVFVMLIIFILYFITPSKNKTAIKITKFSFASLLLTLEVGRMIYRGFEYYAFNGSLVNFDYINAFSFQMCAIMTWLTIITFYLSTFLDYHHKIFTYLYNILFGCSMPGAFLVFLCPDIITPQYPIWHFRNVQTITVHLLLVFLPIYLIKIKEYKPEFRNFWILMVGYSIVGTISMTMSLISNNNFTVSRGMDFPGLKNIIFPLHLPLIFIVMLIYGALVFFVFNKIFCRKHKDEIIVQHVLTYEEKWYMFFKILLTSICIISYLIIAGLIGKDTVSMYGLLCLIPLILNLLGLILIEQSEAKCLAYKLKEA